MAIGIYIIGGRFFVDSKQRTNTAYGVTNQRVIIVSGILNKQIKSLSLRTISDVSLSEKPGGRGSISFGPSNLPSWLTGGAAWPGMSSTAPTFELIDDARSVFEVIRKAQTTAT